MSKKIEERVNRSFTNATPDMQKHVMADCQNTTVYRTQQSKKSTGLFWKFATFALALVLVVTGIVGGVELGATAQAAVVAIDVNPSIEIKIDGRNRVISATANNNDGKIILGTMDLKGTQLEVAVNAIIGSMVRNNYLSELANSVLVSVDTNNAQLYDQIVEKVTGEIQVVMKGENLESSVVAQWMKDTDSAKELAKKHDISVGKAQLIQKILATNTLNADGTPAYTEDTLVALTVNELSLILANLNIADMDGIGSTGTASGKAYIGEDAALNKAIEKLGIEGVTAENILAKRIHLDFDDGVMVYEIEFIYNGCEYEFEVGATSGKVFSMEMDMDFDLDEFNKEPVDDATLKANALLSANVTAEQVVGEVNIEKYDMFGVAVVYFETETAYYEMELTLGGTVVYKAVISLEDFADDTYLTRNQVQQLILQKANISVLDSNVRQFRLHKMLKDVNGATHLVYEVSFIYNNVSYKGTLDAVTGEFANWTVTEVATKDDIFNKHFGEGHHGEMEWDDGKWKYEYCEGGFEYEYEFDRWGNLISQNKERDEEYNPEIPEGETIPAEKLAELKEIIAFYLYCDPSEIANIKVDELEKEHGMSFYEVEFTIDGIEFELKINAVTGTIINDYNHGGSHGGGHGGWGW